MNRGIRYAAMLACVVAIAVVSACAVRAADVFPDPKMDDALEGKSSRRTLVVAGGCFWGIEEVFQHLKGVTDAVSGYAGGSARDARYDIVSNGTTGHAEAVRVTYDPSKISYGQILKIFFSVAHDPTQKGGQGPDAGPQYRSVIFTANARQQQIARAYLEQLTTEHVYRRELTTQVAPFEKFYEAESYHQDYAVKNPTLPYIVMYDLPKVETLRRQFPELYVK